MKAERKPSVLVCVTGQYDCDRLIEAGFELAVEKGWELHVLSVRPPVSDLGSASDEIEHLYRTAKDLGADMTLTFAVSAPHSAADFARRTNARLVVTGMPDSRPNGFVLTLHEIMPKLRMITVTKDNEYLMYGIEQDQRIFA